MQDFSLGNAWSKGAAFLARNPGGHALILIGVGIAVPFAIQLVLVGSAMGTMNPAMVGQSGWSGMDATFAGTFLLAMAVSYVLQLGSYFGSWRLGFGAGESVGGAIVYGLLAGVLVVLAFFAIGMVMALLVQAGAPGFIAVLLLLVPILAFGAALYTAVFAAFAVALFIMFLFALVAGVSLGEEFAGTSDVEGGITLAAAFLLILLTFWFAVRFSCTTAILADRKSYNLPSAMAESWRLTSRGQWRIAGYLALIGIVVCFLFLVVGMMAGVAMIGALEGGGPPAVGIEVQLLMAIVIGIPFAYLTVIVPAGIYRAVHAEIPAADIFA